LLHTVRVDLEKDSKVHYYEGMRCEPPAPQGLTGPAGLASRDGRLRSLRTGRLPWRRDCRRNECTPVDAERAATRARIVDAANQLMYERGVATTLADVRAASATSKSQVYQHFADKDALVKEVIGPGQRTS
jgi:hypothetical protein